MNPDTSAQSLQADVYAQIATIIRDPAAIPLPDALRLIDACLQAGEYLQALDACERLDQFAPSELAALTPDQLKLRQLWALALARCGAASKANEILAQLGERFRDEETLGLLARTYKDLWLQSGDAARLRQARDAYREAHALSGGTWSGINAATLTLLGGDVAQARQLARQVLQALEPLLLRFRAGDAATDDDAVAYWDYATIGEAALILEDHALVDWAYANAARVSVGQFGHRASSLRNAELLLQKQSAARPLVERHFPPPQVVLFAGHMLDAPGRTQPRFEPSAERAIYARILATLRGWQARIGFSSAASGADILFLEALHELGAETNIVLPHPPEQFIRSSVARADGGDWVARFERALQNARQVIVLSQSMGDALTYHFTSVAMAGLATLRSAQLHGTLRGLTVWDLAAGDIGGTGSSVSYWLRHGIAVERLSPRTDEPASTTLQSAQAFATEEEFQRSSRQKIICMLFADAVGFSKLAESQIPLFVERFLGGARAVLERQQRAPLTCNTWGDGLYFTFDSVAQANDCALDLSDFVNTTDWPSHGLPPGMNLRTALHAGPAFEIMDPVTQRAGFTGSHVSRAARIEPKTPPGYVYCSEAHAALVALEHNPAYHCEYVGKLELAKNYGVFPTYSLKRRAAI